MAIMTHAKFHFNRLMLTLSFGIRASEPPPAWQTTEKAGLDRVKRKNVMLLNAAVIQLIKQEARSRENINSIFLVS